MNTRRRIQTRRRSRPSKNKASQQQISTSKRAATHRHFSTCSWKRVLSSVALAGVIVLVLTVGHLASLQLDPEAYYDAVS